MTTGWTFWHSLYDFVNVYWDASPSNSETWEMWEFECIPQVKISDCVIILGVEASPLLSMWKKLSGRLIKLSKKSFDKGMGLLPSLNQTPAPENRPSPQKSSLVWERMGIFPELSGSFWRKTQTRATLRHLPQTVFVCLFACLSVISLAEQILYLQY